MYPFASLPENLTALCGVLRHNHGFRIGPRELQDAARALQLIRGPLLVNRPASRYSWLPRTRMESQSVDVVVDTAHRLARLCGDDDPGGAAAAATAGLRFDPGSQLLWRDLLVAESLDPVDPDTAGVVDQLLGTLQSIGAPLEAETEALIEELLPARKAREQA